MRKKPDILLLLSVLVVSGVVISHFVIIGHSNNKLMNLSSLNAQFQTDKSTSRSLHSSLQKSDVHKLNSRELARIDLSKQQIR